MRRRHFLVLSAASVGGVLVYSLDRKVSRLSAQDKSPAAKPDKSGKAAAAKTVRIPLRFFTESEAAIVAAAVARIFPNDESGPGAHEAGVVIFIDRQLAGPWGRDARRYTHEPFEEGLVPEFGYQSKASPRDVYRQGVKELGGFPGPRMSNVNDIDKHNGEAFRPKPVSLSQVVPTPVRPSEEQTESAPKR